MSRSKKCNIIAAMLFGVIGLIFYMAVDRKPPYAFISGQVIPDVLPSGEQISIHWRVQVHRFCPGWVERNVTDENGWTWRNVGTPVRQVTVDAHGFSDIVNTLELPKRIPRGRASYSAFVCYVCNPLQRWAKWPICVVTPKLPFEVK